MSATGHATTKQRHPRWGLLVVPNWVAALIGVVSVGGFLAWRLRELLQAMHGSESGLVAMETALVIAAATILARVIGRFINPSPAHPLHWCYLLLPCVSVAVVLFPDWGTTAWAVVVTALAAAGTTVIDDIVARRRMNPKPKVAGLGDAAPLSIVVALSLIVLFVVAGVVFIR